MGNKNKQKLYYNEQWSRESENHSIPQLGPQILHHNYSKISWIGIVLEFRNITKLKCWKDLVKKERINQIIIKIEDDWIKFNKRGGTFLLFISISMKTLTRGPTIGVWIMIKKERAHLFRCCYFFISGLS